MAEAALASPTSSVTALAFASSLSLVRESSRRGSTRPTPHQPSVRNNSHNRRRQRMTAAASSETRTVSPSELPPEVLLWLDSHDLELLALVSYSEATGLHARVRKKGDQREFGPRAGGVCTARRGAGVETYASC